MELYQLRTFLVVAAEKNITRAAKRLFTTPPSVSAHIKSLEDEWNVTLFRRTSKGMEITKQGEGLRHKAEATLFAAQDLANHATALQDYLMGTLRIGLNSSATYLRIPGSLERLKNTCPGIDVHLTSGATGKVINQLCSDALDVGYVFGPVPDNTLVSHRLTIAELSVVAPKKWESIIKNADWDDLAKLPWICSDDYCPFQSVVDQLFREHQLQYQRTVHTDDDATKTELVRAGVGLALIEKQEALRLVGEGNAVICSTEAIHSELSLAYLLTRKEDPLIHALRLAVLDAWEVIKDVSFAAG